jgi:quercetin dioxygenase-like cupin family protein
MTTTKSERAGRRWLVGPEDGAEHFLLDRLELPAGRVVGLHKHDGEEAHVVLSGSVRFYVDGEHQVCGPGEVGFAPTGAEHAFRALTDAVLVTVREQCLGSIAVVLEPDGSRREVPIYRNGPPWSNQPPPGVGVTPNEVIDSYYRTTAHLV